MLRARITGAMIRRLRPAPHGGQYRLGDVYVILATRSVQLQLERAGVRLAWILNEALG
jgi:hypothetical protein